MSGVNVSMTARNVMVEFNDETDCMFLGLEAKPNLGKMFLSAKVGFNIDISWLRALNKFGG